MEQLETIAFANPLAQIGLTMAPGLFDRGLFAIAYPSQTNNVLLASQKARHDAMVATIQNTR